MRSNISLDESLLIKGINEQNQFVFEYIFEAYYSGLCGFCKRYIDDKDVIEDIVQDCFFYLWKEGRNIKIKSSLKNYLFTSVQNKCFDVIKHGKVEDKYHTHVKTENHILEDSVNEYFIESELRDIIQTELNKLPDRCKEIFNLSRFQGKSNQEIADYFRISKRTVEVQISKAIKELKIGMKDYLHLLPPIF